MKTTGFRVTEDLLIEGGSETDKAVKRGRKTDKDRRKNRIKYDPKKIRELIF
jgi:hypothetical protein